MKLNPDCIRDVLLFLEEKLDYFYDEVSSTRIEEISWNKLFDDKKLISKYDISDIKYTIQKLVEANYIKASIANGGKKGWVTCDITDITWNGHDFLNTIRGQTIWEATKMQVSKLSGASIRTIGSIAMNITQAVVTNPNFINSIVDKLQQ